MNGKVKLLEQKQQMILAELTAMKKLLLARSATVPTQQLPPSEDIKDDPVEGTSTANIAIIEFTDFQCPFCEMFVRQTYPQILTNYIDTGKIRFLYRDLPSPMHPLAMSAARAARCAQEQGKFWQMHDSLFANQDTFAYNNLRVGARARI